VKTFKPDGTDYVGIKRVIYQSEVDIIENNNKEGCSPYSLNASILENGGINLNFNGVNNPETLQIIIALMDNVLGTELSKGNNPEVLEKLIDNVAKNMKLSLKEKEMPVL
jgi:hypothetical protein